MSLIDGASGVRAVARRAGAGGTSETGRLIASA
jgi:hypothetical protein